MLYTFDCSDIKAKMQGFEVKIDIFIFQRLQAAYYEAQVPVP